MDAGEILSLIAGELGDSAAFLAVAKQFPGKNGDSLRRLAREQRSRAACLRGIYILITGEKPPVGVPEPRREAPQIALRRLFGRALQTMTAFEARSTDPEYGTIFAELAREERRHCRALAEWIGDW